MLEVIDHADRRWFLLRDGDALFLDVNCNHSAIGYSWMVELNADETESYRADGRAYLDQLADAIHMSAPVALGTSSAFRDRDVSNEHSDATTDAVRRWRAGHATP